MLRWTRSSSTRPRRYSFEKLLIMVLAGWVRKSAHHHALAGFLVVAEPSVQEDLVALVKPFLPVRDGSAIDLPAALEHEIELLLFLEQRDVLARVAVDYQ